MAFILCAFFHGRNVTGCKYSAKNYTDSISQCLFLSLTALCTVLLPLSLLQSQHTSESISLCPQPCGSWLRSAQACMCVSTCIRCMRMLLFALFKHNILVSFIAYTYFTTFPALELEEDQTSSVVNFLPEHNLESMPHRKPYSHMHKHTHVHTQRVRWKRRVEGASYITKTNKDFYFSREYLPFYTYSNKRSPIRKWLL